jgi:hypothetical protein
LVLGAAAGIDAVLAVLADAVVPVGVVRGAGHQPGTLVPGDRAVLDEPAGAVVVVHDPLVHRRHEVSDGQVADGDVHGFAGEGIAIEVLAVDDGPWGADVGAAATRNDLRELVRAERVHARFEPEDLALLAQREVHRLVVAGRDDDGALRWLHRTGSEDALVATDPGRRLGRPGGRALDGPGRLLYRPGRLLDGRAVGVVDVDEAKRDDRGEDDECQDGRRGDEPAPAEHRDSSHDHAWPPGDLVRCSRIELAVISTPIGAG